MNHSTTETISYIFPSISISNRELLANYCGEATVAKNNNKGNSDMYTETQNQRLHLETRLEQAYFAKKAAAKVKFGLVPDAPPKNFEELLARLTEGKYTIDEKLRKQRDWSQGLGYIEWRDPAVKQDQDGYDAFKKELTEAYRTTKDDIVVLDPKDGLAALRKFEEFPVQ